MMWNCVDIEAKLHLEKDDDGEWCWFFAKNQEVLFRPQFDATKRDTSQIMLVLLLRC